VRRTTENCRHGPRHRRPCRSDRSTVSRDSSTSSSALEHSRRRTIWYRGPELDDHSSAPTSLAAGNPSPDFACATKGFACPPIASLSSVAWPDSSWEHPETLLARCERRKALETETGRSNDHNSHAQGSLDRFEKVGAHDVACCRRRVAGKTVLIFPYGTRCAPRRRLAVLMG